MVKNQKPKNNTITKLYKILDYNSKKDLGPEDRKYLLSLSQRLKETSGQEIIYKKITSKESQEQGIDHLKPKIIIHLRKVEKKIEFPEVKTEEEEIIDFKDEEIFEIEKAKAKGPEFIEVRPKVIAKGDISEKRELEKELEDIPEWTPVETKKGETFEELPELEPIAEVKLKKEKKEELETRIKFCSECGSKLDKEVDFCPECGTEIKVETTTTFIPVKKVEKEYLPSEWEAIEIEKTKEKTIPIIEKEEKIAGFKDIKSINEEIAVLLYDNGITTVEILNRVSLKDLTKIKGIKKKTSKKIKKEVKKKISELKKEESTKGNVTEDQLPIDVEMEDEIQEWPSTKELTSKTTVWEPVEEETKEKELEKEIPIFEEIISDKEAEKPIIDKDSKIEVFKNIKSIDNEIAVLLYDNGYTTTDALITASLKDLTKIKGINRKTASKIIKDIKKIKTKPILIPTKELEEIKKTDDILKIEEELDKTKQSLETITQELNTKENNIQQLQKEIEDKTKNLETSNNEINKRDKEIEKIKTDLQTKTEELDKKQQTIIQLTEQQKELENREKEIKTKIFKDIKSIDDETAILLYDNGITTVYTLTNTSHKDLIKIKGIRRKTIKNIKKELETITQEMNTKENNIQQLQKEIEDKTKNLETSNNEINKKDEEIEHLQDELKQKGKELEKRNLESNKKQEEIEKVKTDLQTKTEELDKKQQTIIQLTEQQKELENREKEIKTKIFNDIESIDDKTAILLYDNGITNIDILKTISQKDLTKIKGIKTKTAKKIKKEIEQKFVQGSFQVIETEKKDVFRDINSIDNKISGLLKENGLNTLDSLRKATIKDLTKIRGIKRKVAKKIKKEISNLPEENVDIKSESSLKQGKSSRKKKKDEKESYDKNKTSYSKKKKIKGFKYEDYSLYKKEIGNKSGKKRIVRFFSKNKPDKGEPIKLPKGYEVKKNKKTGLPYLRKKK